MATKNQVTKAKAMEISNLAHGRPCCVLQKSKSFAYKTATPADEHAAASDRVAVTCIAFYTMMIIIIIFSHYYDYDIDYSSLYKNLH